MASLPDFYGQNSSRSFLRCCSQVIIFNTAPIEFPISFLDRLIIFLLLTTKHISPPSDSKPLISYSTKAGGGGGGPPNPRGPSGAPLLLRTSSRARALPGQSTRGRARGAVAQRIAPSVKCTSCRAGEGAWGAGMRRGWGVMVYGVRADATCGGASG